MDKLQISVLNLQCAFCILFDARETDQLDGLHRRGGLLRVPDGSLNPGKEQSDRNKNPRCVWVPYTLLVLNSSFSTNVHQHERNVVGRRPLAPRSHAVENPLFHLVGRQRRGTADDFLDTFDAQHLSLGIENFGNSVGIQNDAVIGLELHFQGRL